MYLKGQLFILSPSYVILNEVKNLVVNLRTDYASYPEDPPRRNESCSSTQDTLCEEWYRKARDSSAEASE
jgi:hypothetical protein